MQSLHLFLKRTSKKWTDEEDNKLIEEFKSGKSLTELASIHGRTKGAIRSRLRKLGVVD